MAATATWIKDSFGPPYGYHLRVIGCLAGKNSLNPQTLITDISMAGSYASFVPQGILFFPIYDGTHATASKWQYDPATLTATNIDLYCDAVGGTSCDIWAY